MQEDRFDLAFEDEPDRVIRGRVESPGAGTALGPWAMLMHGFKGHMDWGFFPLLSRGLAESGITAVRFNSSGCGVGADLKYFSDPEAFEKDTYSRQLEDMAAVREAVDSGELGDLDPEQGIFIGHSRGGGLGILHAAEHSYRGIATWAAISEPKFFPESLLQLWRDQGYLDIPNTRTGDMMRVGIDAVHDVEQNPSRFDILEWAKTVSAPALIVHGSADEIVPADNAHKLVAALPQGRLELIEGAAHTFGASEPLSDVPPELAQALGATLGFVCESLGLRVGG